MKNKRVVSLAVAVSLVTACSGGGSASGTVGARGGSVSLGSALTVTLPAGAVSDDTVIEVRQTGENAFELRPDGLELQQPAEVELEAEHEMEIVESEHLAERQSFDGHRMHCQVTKLGPVSMRQHGADDADAGAGDSYWGMGTDEADGGVSGGIAGGGADDGHGGHR